jgi:hypothetical protein
MAPLPNCFLCFFAYVIVREKQGEQLGGGGITDGTEDAKNACVDGPLRCKILGFPYQSQQWFTSGVAGGLG